MLIVSNDLVKYVYLNIRATSLSRRAWTTPAFRIISLDQYLVSRYQNQSEELQQEEKMIVMRWQVHPKRCRRGKRRKMRKQKKKKVQ